LQLFIKFEKKAFIYLNSLIWICYDRSRITQLHISTIIWDRTVQIMLIISHY